jgi:hypothetical protein
LLAVGYRVITEWAAGAATIAAEET